MQYFQAEFQGACITVNPAETLLNAFLRQAVNVPFSCKAGSCHKCMLRCIDGDVPPDASKRLATHLQDKGYFLNCQCYPTSDMQVELPRTADQITNCMLTDARETDHEYVFVQFETARALPCLAGQRLQIVVGDTTLNQPALMLDITHVYPELSMIEGLVHLTADSACPVWLQDAIIGSDFQVIGPVDVVATLVDEMPTDAQAHPTHEERLPPEADVGLWHALGDGVVVRAVLEDFYAQIYQDPELAPFFHGVTVGRAIDKQYSFLKQLMTGEKGYFGDRPRNAHHWMVITDEVFDYRQALMVNTLKKHGLDDVLIARWTRFELHYRADIVKSAAIARRVGDAVQPMDGFLTETLSTGAVCDYCHAVLDAGTVVQYHSRLGKISCNTCAPPVLINDVKQGD